MTKSLEEKLLQYFPFIKDYPKPSGKERQEFQAILKPLLRQFKGISEADLVQVLKVLKSHLSSLKEAQEARVSQGKKYKEAIRENKAYHKGIKNLEESLEFLYSDSVSQVIFQGIKENEGRKKVNESWEISISGKALEIIQKVFFSFYSEDLTSQQEKDLKNILPEYAEAYQEFHNQLKVLDSNSPLAIERKNKLEADSIEYGFNQEKYRIGYHLNKFILDHSHNSRNAKRPDLTKKILGNLLDLSGIEEYDSLSLKKYDNYISRKP